jgi:hypothetical protein
VGVFETSVIFLTSWYPYLKKTIGFPYLVVFYFLTVKNATVLPKWISQNTEKHNYSIDLRFFFWFYIYLKEFSSSPIADQWCLVSCTVHLVGKLSNCWECRRPHPARSWTDSNHWTGRLHSQYSTRNITSVPCNLETLPTLNPPHINHISIISHFLYLSFCIFCFLIIILKKALCFPRLTLWIYCVYCV